MADPGNLSLLFVRLRRGDAYALNEVMSALHEELRRLAARHMRSEARDHTLQPTALVHEAYFRLMRGPEVIADRKHFFALAAQAMRRVLVDHARGKKSGKRGGALERVTLEHVPGESAGIDVIDLHHALEELEQLEPRVARVVELRFFGGHTDKEVCEILDANLPTVRRDWTFARAWLKARIGKASRHDA